MGVSGFRPAPQVGPAKLEQLGTGPSRTGWHSSQYDEQWETNPQVIDLDGFRMWWLHKLAPIESRSRGWRLTDQARAVVGLVAIIGTVVALKGGAPSSNLFAHNGSAHTQLQDDKTLAQSSDAGPISGKDSSQSAHGEVAKGPPVDLSAPVSLAPFPVAGSAEDLKIQPAAGASNAASVAQEIDASAVASLSAQPPSMQSPNVGPARPVSSTSGATVGAVETTRPPSPKHPGKLTNRIAAPSAETTAPTAAPDAPREPPALAKPAKPDEASAPKAQAAADTATAQPASPEASKPPLNPLLRAIGDLFGVRSSPALQPIDPTHTTSTAWAVQLATLKTEAEAKSTLKRLNAKYASALNGSTIRVRKARVDGEIRYRLRVGDLSKSKAEALCSRLKGDGGACFIVR